MNTIVFLPSNEINVRKNTHLLNTLESEGYRILILCIEEVGVRSIKNHQSIVDSDFDYLCLSGEKFNNNRHWFLQAFQNKLIVEQLGPIFDKDLPVLFLTAFEGGVVPYWICNEFKKNQIPVVLIPDGLVVEQNENYSAGIYLNAKIALSSFARRLCGIGGERGSGRPDHVLLLNASGKDTFLKYGVNPNRIHVVGSPEYEIHGVDPSYATLTNSSKRKLLSSIGLEHDRPIVFYAHQPLPGLNTAALRRLISRLSAAVRQCNASLVFKFHHRSDQSIPEWENWRESMNLGDQNVVFADKDVYSVDILKAASVCITAYSTVGLEALMYKTPLIVVRYFKAQHRLSYAERYNCAWDVFSLDELERATVSLLKDAKMREDFISRGLESLKCEIALGEKSSIEQSIEVLNAVIGGRSLEPT